MPVAETLHGEIRFETDQVIKLLGGPIGFSQVTDFILLENADIEPFRWLVAVDDSQLSFAVIDPRSLVDGYKIELTQPDRERLQIDESSDVLPLVIAVLGARPEESTANLKAPIVVNSTRMVAAQIVLTSSKYDVKHPLLATASESRR